jgi:DNA-directed RNA polymerase specialized sigma24 family protein
MSIDVKWLLYKYHQLQEAKKNAERLIEYYKRREASAADPNWWIHGKGGLPRSRTEFSVIKDYEAVEQLIILEGYLKDVNFLVDAINSAWKTLNSEQRDLIRLRYFEDKSVDEVAEKLHFDLRKYYRVHSIALEGMTICLGATCQMMDVEKIVNNLAPKKERHRIKGLQLA